MKTYVTKYGVPIALTAVGVLVAMYAMNKVPQVKQAVGAA